MTLTQYTKKDLGEDSHNIKYSLKYAIEMILGKPLILSLVGGLALRLLAVADPVDTGLGAAADLEAY